MLKDKRIPYSNEYEEAVYQARVKRTTHLLTNLPAERLFKIYDLAKSTLSKVVIGPEHKYLHSVQVVNLSTKEEFEYSDTTPLSACIYAYLYEGLDIAGFDITEAWDYQTFMLAYGDEVDIGKDTVTVGKYSAPINPRI